MSDYEDDFVFASTVSIVVLSFLFSQPVHPIDSGCDLVQEREKFQNNFEYDSQKIHKSESTMRQTIPAHERLAFTLRFLACGDSYHSLSATFKVSKQMMSLTVLVVCNAVIEALQDYIKVNTSSLYKFYFTR